VDLVEVMLELFPIFLEAERGLNFLDEGVQ
jgi:hypothetical protein